MPNQDIQLTAEQRGCVNFPLNQQVLIINAGPGTGKTTIIEERVKFIVKEKPNQQQLVLVLAFNKNISLDIWRKLKLIIRDKVNFLEKSNEFSQRDNFASFSVMNRTFHSLCYSIFSKELAKISEKDFKIVFEREIKVHNFPFLTDSTSNIVEYIKKEKDFRGRVTSDNLLKFTILGKLDRFILRKRNNNISRELREKLITGERGEKIWRKISITKEISPVIHRKIIYEEYLAEVHSVLTQTDRLDMYEPIKEFFLNDQRKRFWLIFDDLIENVASFLGKSEKARKPWQVFDHILVDECQDLTESKLNIVKSLCSPQTTLTFVGDPKQTIYGFRGSKSSIFESIKSLFPNSIQKDITESFRSHQGIVAVANDFSQKFLRTWHYVDLKSRKEGEKPLVFFGKNSQEQVDFLVEQIDQICEPARKSILFRKKESGMQITKELKKKNYGFIELYNKSDEGTVEIIKRLRSLETREIMGDFFNIKDLLEKLNIQLVDSDIISFVEEFDHNLEIERQQRWEKESKLTFRQITNFVDELEDWVFFHLPMNSPIGKIVLSTIHGSKGLEFDYVFLVDVDEGILPHKKAKEEEGELEEARIFYVGITRAEKKLYLCSLKMNLFSVPIF